MVKSTFEEVPMRWKLFICLVVCACLMAGLYSACTPVQDSDEQLLNELDVCIENKAHFQAAREVRIDSLRTLLQSCTTDGEIFEQYGRLVEEFRSYNLDSQLYYTEQRLRLAATPFEKQVSLLNYSEVMMRNGMYYEAIVYMDSSLQKPLNGVLYPYYYHLKRTLYGSMMDFAVSDQERDHYASLTQQYRDSMMHIHKPGSFLHELVRADYLYAEHEYDSALHVLEAYEKAHLVDGQNEEAVFAVTRAQIYRALGDTQKEKHYLIISSLADLKGAIREYISLRDLALLLYKNGDINRAFRYMECAVNDASDGSVRIRSMEVSLTYPVVEEAYRQQVHRRQMTLLALLVNVLIIVALLIIAIYYVTRQRRKLALLNARLEDSNDNLKASNQIKTFYVGRYMEMTSLLIDRVDAWRKQLKGLAHDKKYDKLNSILSSHQFTQEQLNAFYADFDKAFIELFPHFVRDVQALLVPEAEIHIKEGEYLNTDLRVLALIRLGITDSKQISNFLRYSLSTIYNSRTRMRNLYRGNRDEFEQKVATL